MFGLSNKRRWLAVYLDYLVFSALWAPFAFYLRAHVPVFSSWYASFIAFSLAEVVLMGVLRAPPSAFILGLRTNSTGPHVDPRWLARERWWTMLAGVLGMMEGVKEAVRFSQGLPPPPFMGLDLSWDQRGAAVTVNGWLYLLAGIGVLRCHTRAALFGMMLSAVSLTSWMLSWEQIPGWVEARTIARRASQGIAVRAGEVAFMQKVLPGGALFAGAVGCVWLFFVWRHFRARDDEQREI